MPSIFSQIQQLERRASDRHIRPEIIANGKKIIVDEGMLKNLVNQDMDTSNKHSLEDLGWRIAEAFGLCDDKGNPTFNDDD